MPVMGHAFLGEASQRRPRGPCIAVPLDLLKHSLPPDSFQEYATHPAEWSAALSSKGSVRPCLRSGRATCLRCACTAHAEDVGDPWGVRSPRRPLESPRPDGGVYGRLLPEG